MFGITVVAIVIAIGFLVGTFAPDDRLDPIRKNYPSGAAANVSHNRPVRMLLDQRNGRSGDDGGRVGPIGSGMSRTAGGGGIRGPCGAAGSPQNAFGRNQRAEGQLGNWQPSQPEVWRAARPKGHRLKPQRWSQMREGEAPAGLRRAARQTRSSGNHPRPSQGIGSPAHASRLHPYSFFSFPFLGGGLFQSFSSNSTTSGSCFLSWSSV